MDNKFKEEGRKGARIIDPDLSVGGRKFWRPAANHGFAERPYTFSRPTPDRGYMKALKYIAENPGCKRADITDAAGWNPGTHQSVFQDMSHAELFRISTKGEYFITAKGAALVKDVYGKDGFLESFKGSLRESTEDAFQEGYDDFMEVLVSGHRPGPEPNESPYPEGTEEDESYYCGWIAAYDNNM